MADQKFENLLNISLEATKSEREKSLDLNVGVNENNNVWEIIVKHTGSISFLEELYSGVSVTELLNGYAVLLVPEELLDIITSHVEIEYVEKPKLLFFQDYAAFSVSCINTVKTIPLQLNGSGIITAIIDSGINVLLPEFRNEDGNTRIISLWDQTADGVTDYYGFGREYDINEINDAIGANEMIGADIADHGTPVASLACGNSGVADKSDIIIVKLSTSRERGFPRTTQIMMGVDYVIRKAAALGRPVAVNISLGNNYGSHTGTSIFERYMDDVSRYWKSVICVGSGNEASASTHTSGYVYEGQEKRIRFAVSSYQPSINLQIWKNYADDFRISLVTPDNKEIGPLSVYNRVQRFEFHDMMILGYLGEPSPYSVNQEIYFEFIPKNDYIFSGIWQVKIVPVRVADGRYDMWLPADAALNVGTGFLEANPDNTMTIPSTASGVITVGAYDSTTDAYAPFSGRGASETFAIKPDIVAPGVNVESVSSGGLIRRYSGTSFAAPIVTGSAALLMEWGITRGNDSFLFGEKVKAYMIKGARQLSGYESHNISTGWGALCTAASIPSR